MKKSTPAPETELETELETETAPAAKTFQLPQAIQSAVNRVFGRKTYWPAGLPKEAPATMNECHALWRRFRPDYYRSDCDPAARALIKSARARAFALQQGSTAPDIDLKALGAARADVICNGEARRVALAAELQAALDSGFDTALIPERQIPDVFLTYLNTDGQEAAKLLRHSTRRHELRLIESFNLTSPLNRADERRAALNSNPSPEVLAKIVAESQLEESEHFQQICRNRKAELQEAWKAEGGPGPLQTKLLEDALRFANGCRETAIAAEQELYTSNGVPHDGSDAKTEVGRKFDAAISDLAHSLERLRKHNGGPLVDCEGSSVLWSVFGVRLT